MEWQGINLSARAEQKWLTNAIRNLCWTALTVIIALSAALFLWATSGQLQANFYQNQQTIQRQQHQLAQLQHHITQLKQDQQHAKTEHYLTPLHMQRFIDYLNHFAVQGAIETSQIYFDDNTQIKLFGKANHQSEFDAITQQLKQLHYAYKIENIQLNETNQYEFSLLITFQDNQDEKVDSRQLYSAQ